MTKMCRAALLLLSCCLVCKMYSVPAKAAGHHSSETSAAGTVKVAGNNGVYP
jgi:hypothetical protein